MQIERTLDGGDRQLVQIGADCRQRRRVVSVLARRNTTEINLSKARPRLLDCYRRQEFHDIGKFLHLQLVEFLGADCRDCHRHILQILLTLLRGNDNNIIIVIGCSFLRHGWHSEPERGRGQQCRNSKAGFW